jgi:nitroreductase
MGDKPNLIEQAKDMLDGGRYDAAVARAAIAQAEAQERQVDALERIEEQVVRDIGLRLERLVLATNTVGSYLCRIDEKLERQVDAQERIACSLEKLVGCVSLGASGNNWLQVITHKDGE